VTDFSQIGVATGRGGHLASEAGFEDSTSHNGVTILRPLKEFSDEEIRYYVDSDQSVGEACGDPAITFYNIYNSGVAHIV
jgi:hypothetical protein